VAQQRHWLEHVLDLIFGCIASSPGCCFCSQLHRWEENGVPRGYIVPNPRWRQLVRGFQRNRVLHDYEPCLDHPVVAAAVAALTQELLVLLSQYPAVEHWFLSKHPERYEERFPRELLDHPQCNFGVSIESQAQMYRLETLSQVAPRRMFVSAQPLLGPLAFPPPLLRRLEWVILGVECGPERQRRRAHPDWFNNIKLQCRRAEIDVFTLTAPTKSGGIQRMFHRLGEDSHDRKERRVARQQRRALKFGATRECDYAPYKAA
jgi:hypothetical protein